MEEKQITIGDKTITVYAKQSNSVINDTKYEDHIRIAHTATGSYGNYVVNENNWHNFPVATTMHRTLHDVDRDGFTDLKGFTHRNRVRNNVEDIELGFAILNDNDEKTILDLINPQWIYVELVDKRTKQKAIHKMYASDKEWDTYHVWKDKATGNWCEANTDFSFSLVEE